MKAVCLVSGGLDSTTCMALAKSEGRKIYSLSFFYGQRHNYEIQAAKRVSAHIGVEKHLVIDLEINKFSLTSSLIDEKQDIPTSPVSQANENEPLTYPPLDIPSTYVPARNLIFLSYAVCWAESLSAKEIFIGANAVDYSGYPDCRPEFIESFQRVANLATKAGAVDHSGIIIRTPLINMTKAEIILTGMKLGVDFSLTSSCYQPDNKGEACGRCHSCQLRLKGFREAGIRDPLVYRDV